MLNRTCVYIVIGLCLCHLHKKLDFACIWNQEEMLFMPLCHLRPLQNTDPGANQMSGHLAKRDMTTFVTILLCRCFIFWPLRHPWWMPFEQSADWRSNGHMKMIQQAFPNVALAFVHMCIRWHIFMLPWTVNVYLFSWSWHFQFLCWLRW